MNAACAWVSVLSALLTPAVALAVCLIAYRQWRTAQNRLKLDLFDRRLAIHTEALGIILRAVTKPMEPLDLSAFETAVRQSRWLLDKEIEQYFRKEFIPKLVEFQVNWMAGIKSDMAERKENFYWLTEQEDALDAKFDCFLKIKA
jgi:hypothetical protein